MKLRIDSSRREIPQNYILLSIGCSHNFRVTLDASESVYMKDKGGRSGVRSLTFMQKSKPIWQPSKSFYLYINLKPSLKTVCD